MKRVYNRYIPKDTPYIPAGRRDSAREEGFQSQERQGPAPRESSAGGGRTPQRGEGLPPFFSGKETLTRLLAAGEGKNRLSALLKSFKFGDWDSGDILLLLIVLFLLAEGDDLELLIALGLALMMGLGNDGEGHKES